MLRNTGGGSQRHAFKEAVAVDGGGLNLWPLVLFGAHMHQRSGEDDSPGVGEGGAASRETGLRGGLGRRTGCIGKAEADIELTALLPRRGSVPPNAGPVHPCHAQ